MSTATRYRLYYWPGLQGRGELIRLVLEDAGADYVDVVRQPAEAGGGVAALLEKLHDPTQPAHYAPPLLEVDGVMLSQTALILHTIAPSLGLAPSDDAGRARALQLQLTVADMLSEVHDTHHPISTARYYEEQKPQAKQRSDAFTGERMGKLMGYFERVLNHTRAQPGAARGGLLGAEISYVDLSLFQLLEGLKYAFPKALAKLAPSLPGLLQLAEQVAQRPRLAAYLSSPRRLPFNEHGIFRHYPELDLDEAS